ncbi:MAG: heme-binding protein [Acidobacteriota bacterium]
MRLSLAAALLAAVVAPAAHAQLANKKALTLEAAKKIVAACEAEARKNNWTMVITVVDDGGLPILLERMDGTQIGSVIIAQEKAASAVKFKRPTKALEDAVTGGRNVVMTLPGALPVEGGIPIMIGAELIGAVGVSGGSSPQDAQVATAGVKVAEAMK